MSAAALAAKLVQIAIYKAKGRSRRRVTPGREIGKKNSQPASCHCKIQTRHQIKQNSKKQQAANKQARATVHRQHCHRITNVVYLLRLL